jgi:hypothetical protein
LAFGFCFYSGHYVFAQTNQTASKLQAANTAIDGAFNAVSDAEKAGANVTGLLAQLNIAASDLSQAENSYRSGDSNTAAVQADNVLPIAQEITASAQNAKQTASVSSQNGFWFTNAFSEIGAPIFVLALFLAWRKIKRDYMNKLPGLKPEVAENTA